MTAPAGRAPARLVSDLGLYRRLAAEGRPYWPHLSGVFLLGLLATPIALLTPLPLSIAVDAVTRRPSLPSFLEASLPAGVTGSTTGVLAVAAVLLVLIALLTQFQQFGVSVLGTYTGEKLLLRFRARLFRRVQRLSIAFHDRRGTADSTYRIQDDAPCIQWIAIYGVTPFFGAAFTLAGMLYVTARIDWELALIALAVVPVLLLLTTSYRRQLRARWKTTKVLESEALRVVQEVLTSLRVVKAFGGEEREEARFLLRSGQGTRARIGLAAIEGLFGFLTGMTVALGSAAVLYVGGTHVVQGTITPGQLTLVFGYLLGLYAPLQQISKSIVTLQSSLASAERAFSLLDEVQEVPEAPHPRALTRARGTVEFRDVSFAYEGGRPALDGVSFTVPAGARVGIAGATGAGKTTLANLLTRFYDPDAGAILLDGVDLREYRLSDLRRQFAIVLQEPVLFSTTIAENIAYARPGASLDEIVAASAAADAHTFIAALPEGYDTVVGERGMRLSGGERQRVSLARAFLKDAPILILDEPTSSVDVRTEATIIDAMERLMVGRTTFLIAHRLSTLDSCDTRLEVDGGRLAGLPREAVPR